MRLRMAPQRFFCLSTFLCITVGLPTNCKLQRKLVETCYFLLQNTGGLYPLHCLENNSLLPFPKTAFETSTSTTQQGIAIEKSIYISLMNIFSIFNNYGVPNQWNHKNFEDFQNIIFRQTEESKCVMNKSEVSSDDFLRRETLLNAYYKKLGIFLKQKDYKYCAWEFVRNEIINILQVILRVESILM